MNGKPLPFEQNLDNPQLVYKQGGLQLLDSTV